ncbi:hypothetical protein [Gloeobacter kilaueensis]|uniref:Uncharacterized protein n=1 Tax=Gloeobacter kilaueensis (strain ATCC BAA-2537 / CCAP 1431/1 / ULC 316 / JS1) TaxID=1183438 RepID=U5QHB9_GLOK1|nr:hypothetical protein [Gloeobacter kilaueensis]AGY58347.1 hypothetical protein GKIL_2101 [Gloeobacter kilaueensis JS1]
MKDLLLCERTIGEVKLRGYRLQDHFLIAVWGVPGSSEQPKRLVCHDFEHLNDLWRTWQQIEPQALIDQLAAFKEGMLPKPKPKIFKKPEARGPSGGGLIKKQTRPSADDGESLPENSPPKRRLF